jgi:hypothetical protein
MLVFSRVLLSYASCLSEQVIPGTGELVIFGFNLDRPFLTVGIVSGFTI